MDASAYRRRLLARIAALIPPPRSPLIRFHGAFAAHCRHRVRIVAGASESRSPPAPCLQTIPPGKINSDVDGRRRQAELGTAPCSKPSSKGAEPESHPRVASTSDPAQAMAALSRGPAGRAPTPAAPAQGEGAARENPWRPPQTRARRRCTRLPVRRAPTLPRGRHRARRGETNSRPTRARPRPAPGSVAIGRDQSPRPVVAKAPGGGVPLISERARRHDASATTAAGPRPAATA